MVLMVLICFCNYLHLMELCELSHTTSLVFFFFNFEQFCNFYLCNITFDQSNNLIPFLHACREYYLVPMFEMLLGIISDLKKYIYSKSGQGDENTACPSELLCRQIKLEHFSGRSSWRIFFCFNWLKINKKQKLSLWHFDRIRTVEWNVGNRTHYPRRKFK